MLTSIHPKLPMRNKAVTRAYYLDQLGFEDIGAEDFAGYLIVSKDQVELHFFEFRELNPQENYGQVYMRTDNVRALYASFMEKGVSIHPNGPLKIQPWGMMEFSLLDPDHNLLTFGQEV